MSTNLKKKTNWIECWFDHNEIKRTEEQNWLCNFSDKNNFCDSLIKTLILLILILNEYHSDCQLNVVI